MLPERLDIDEHQAMHRTQPFTLFWVKISNADNEESLLDTQALA
jgi:hypothetical protein